MSGRNWKATDLGGFAPCSGGATPVRFVAEVSTYDEPVLLCLPCLSGMAEAVLDIDSVVAEIQPVRKIDG